MNATDKRTLVEDGTVFKGSLSSSCPVHVKGGIEGEVDAPSLIVANTGKVSGKVRASELRSEGELSGEFDVEKVQLSGTVRDNTKIRAQSLEVKLTSQTGGKMEVLFGECELDVGDQPSREKGEAKRDAAKETNGKSVPPPEAV